MYDLYKRNINYLRVSVTDRCNLRCIYCMPEEGVKLLSHGDILRIEEIVEIVRQTVKMGITKVRITGGEPLLRKGLTELIRQLNEILGIEDLSLTTNAQLLEGMAAGLKESGLHRVNISLDTLNPDRYRILTRGGDINKTLRGIQAALDAGLQPVKINCVIENSPLEKDAVNVKQWAESKGLKARFIHRMTLEKGYFTTVEGGEGGNCVQCNRLRLTANGMLKPCLFSDLEFDVRKLGISEAFEAAVKAKPACGSVNHTNMFYNIGG